MYTSSMTDHTAHYLAAVNVILEKDGKILLSRRQNKGWGDGLLCIPGGHVEPGELPLEATLRELKEELGITAKPEDLQFLCVEAKTSPTRHYLSCIFVLKTNQAPVNNEPHECSELVWVDPVQPGDEVIENFKQIIERAYVGSDSYLEYETT